MLWREPYKIELPCVEPKDYRWRKKYKPNDRRKKKSSKFANPPRLNSQDLCG